MNGFPAQVLTDCPRTAKKHLAQRCKTFIETAGKQMGAKMMIFVAFPGSAKEDDVQVSQYVVTHIRLAHFLSDLAVFPALSRTRIQLWHSPRNSLTGKRLMGARRRACGRNGVWKRRNR